MAGFLLFCVCRFLNLIQLTNPLST
jgi:hypothetical protein